jgi:predicted phosphodiesterase
MKIGILSDNHDDIAAKGRLPHPRTYPPMVDIRAGNMLIINPGTVSDVLTDARTCTIYDTGTRKAESIEL